MRRQRGPDEEKRRARVFRQEAGSAIEEALQEAASRRPIDPRLYADTLRANRRDFSRILSRAGQPTADSIMAVLGEPERAPQSISTIGAGHFLPQSRELAVSPQLIIYGLMKQKPELTGDEFTDSAYNRVSGVVAHEMAHAALNPVVEGGKYDRAEVEWWSEKEGLPFPSLQTAPALQDLMGFRNRFRDRLNEADRETRAAVVEDYYGGDFDRQVREKYPSASNEDIIEKVLTLYDRIPAENTLEMEELLANALQRGYQIARRADPNDPSKVSDEVRELDERLPGTREAFNFWIRNLMGLDERGNRR